MGGFFNFLRRQPSRDVAHLLADVVPPFIRREGLKLGFDVDGRLPLEPRASGLVIQGAVARAAGGDITQGRAVDDDGRGRLRRSTYRG